MSNFILSDVRFIYDGHDLSGNGNTIDASESYAMLDPTSFANVSRIYRPGLPDGKFSFAGFTTFGVGSVEETLNARRGIATGIPVFISKTGDAGDRCHFFLAAQANLNTIQNKVGEILGFSVDGTFGRGASAIGIINGPVLESGKTARTSAGQSSPILMTGPLTVESLYATIHVLAFTGTNLTLKIQSAAAGDPTFTSPTDRFTQSGITAIGGFYLAPLAGPITDDRFRVDWSGTFTSFEADVAIGVR